MMGLNVKRRLRIRGFSSESTSTVREEIEPVRAAVKRVAENVKKEQRLSRDERGRLKMGLIRASQHHRRLLRSLKAMMAEV